MPERRAPRQTLRTTALRPESARAKHGTRTEGAHAAQALRAEHCGGAETQVPMQLAVALPVALHLPEEYPLTSHVQTPERRHCLMTCTRVSHSARTGAEWSLARAFCLLVVVVGIWRQWATLSALCACVKRAWLCEDDVKQVLPAGPSKWTPCLSWLAVCKRHVERAEQRILLALTRERVRRRC